MYVCMYVQDGGPSGHVFVSSGLQFHFGQSTVVAAVVNAERVHSVGLKFVLHKYANFISRMFPTREICVNGIVQWSVSISVSARRH